MNHFFTFPSTFSYKIKRVNYTLKNFPFQNYKILQLSDLHLGFGLKPDMLNSLVKSVRQVDPDLVVITGDLIEGDLDQLLPSLEPLRVLAGAYPLYMVVGNHDFEHNAPGDVVAALSSLGISVLLNRSVVIGAEDAGFNLAGISDPIAVVRDLPAQYYPDIDTTLKNCDQNLPTVLLSHRPILRYGQERYGVDLILSGHLHGGQIYPFGLLSIKLKEDSGEKISVKDVDFGNHRYLHVSKGLGFTTLPLRLFVPSEMSLITLNPL